MSTPIAGSYGLPQELVDLRTTIARIAAERITPRAGDLALQPDVPLEQFANQIISWIEGT